MSLAMPNAAEFVAPREPNSAGTYRLEVLRLSHGAQRRDLVNNRVNGLLPEDAELIEAARPPCSVSGGVTCAGAASGLLPR
jgi:hypothetical protein